LDLGRKLLQLFGGVDKNAANIATTSPKESPSKVNPELEAESQQLKSDVKDLRYQKLQSYLQNEQWKEANEETYRLIIQIAGKEEGQSLDSEDLENFPSEEFNTINQLWLSNSQGKFGFSVQKEIYEGLGGTREYDEKVWNSFGDRVGWRKDENWVSYSDLVDISLEEAKQGYFPTPWGEQTLEVSGYPGRQVGIGIYDHYSQIIWSS
ncbi:MAG: GUN4 domain-containing protein, partial [Xenococcus sp. MO_188.B8]|nr:GUN4 domain-containing protein [Xenococcus sp. MO_188.B8]